MTVTLDITQGILKPENLEAFLTTILDEPSALDFLYVITEKLDVEVSFYTTQLQVHNIERLTQALLDAIVHSAPEDEERVMNLTHEYEFEPNRIHWTLTVTLK